jgi:DNA-binding HxlR family transcriptional regulator
MSRRSYQQYCGVAQALDVLGERWTLLVVRDLLLGPRRYGEIAAQLPAAGTDLITARLKTLVEHGLVARVNSGGTGGGVTYRLTEAGERLRPLVEELALVGLEWLPAPIEAVDQLDLSWGLATIRIHMDPTATPVGSCRIGAGDRYFVLNNDGVEVALSYESIGTDTAASITGGDFELLAVFTSRMAIEDTSVVASASASEWIEAIQRAAPSPLRADAVAD